MIVKIAVFCIAVATCLQSVAIERHRRALIHANAAIKILAQFLNLEDPESEANRKSNGHR